MIMRIGELAKSAGVSVETVRYYQRRGLLDIPERPYGENRHYSTSHRDRLYFIKRAQALGFTLSEISSLLELSAYDCAEVESVANRKLLRSEERRVGKECRFRWVAWCERIEDRMRYD